MEEHVQPKDDTIENIKITHSPSVHHDMHIVQLPIDQIYRALPSRNASTTESSISDTDHDQSSCTSFLTWLLLVFIIIGLLIIIILSIVYLALKPRNPKFFLENLNIKNTHSSDHQENSHLNWNIFMKTENPNAHIGLLYLKGGSAFISFKEQKIATGEPPSFYHAKNHSISFRIVLKSLKKGLPREIKTRLMENSKLEVQVPLKLSMKVPLKLKLWFIKAWNVKMEITCYMRVSGMTKGGHVVSEGCHRKVHF